MHIPSSIAEHLDAENLAFTAPVKAELANLSEYPTDSLVWLMVEHYQFSSRNTSFLARAADIAKGLAGGEAAEAELRRNLAEENGHAAMYKAALTRIGIAVDERLEFPPTTYFFYRIGALLEKNSSYMLGAIYATETAAIFEHEVFLDISKEIIRRGNFANKEGVPLVAFHEMHLSGVEQSHKDELGIFLQNVHPEQVGATEIGVTPSEALKGGQAAIAAMRQWWQDLLGPITPMAIAA